MNLINTPLMARLNHYLDAAAFRSGIIAENIANIDTPGYRARDIDFKSQLASQLSSSPGDDPRTAKPRATEVAGLTERPDGNNVNMDREGLALAETQLQFQTGIALMKSEIHRLSQAIHEGGAQ